MKYRNKGLIYWLTGCTISPIPWGLHSLQWTTSRRCQRLEYTASNKGWPMNDNLQRMWKEGVVALGGKDWGKPWTSSVNITVVLAGIQTEHLPNMANPLSCTVWTEILASERQRHCRQFSLWESSDLREDVADESSLSSAVTWRHLLRLNAAINRVVTAALGCH